MWGFGENRPKNYIELLCEKDLGLASINPSRSSVIFKICNGLHADKKL